MGGDFTYVLLLGLFPFIALPVFAVIALYIWKATWLQRATSLLVLAFGMMAVVIALSLINFPWYSAPVAWIAPLAAFLVSMRWQHVIEQRGSEVKRSSA